MDLIATLLPLALNLIQTSLPLIGGASPAVSTAIKIITAAAPVVYSTYRDLIPIVKRSIAVLKADSSTTDAQIAELEAAEAILDQDFDEAAAAALAEDRAAGA